MEQVTLQAIKQMRLSRSNGSGVVGEASENSGGFMQIVDSMLGNLIDGDSGVITDSIFGGNLQSDEDATDDASLLTMLSELLQSGGNISDNLLSMLKNIVGDDGISKVELPNIISKLQENNFFEALGADDATADALYDLGNNTHNFVDSQLEVLTNFINSKLENAEPMVVAQSLNSSQGKIVTGTMQQRTPSAEVKNSTAAEFKNEIPITSVSYEKSTSQVVQPIGVTVPNMVSQRIVKADLTQLSQQADDGPSENQDFTAQLSAIATANANLNTAATEIELPKAQTLSNPLFNEFQLSEQITDGVKANLNLEKSEFTVKLNPESLGELTLKLVEENGKMVLDITAASERTARLLNGDIAALRESVGSMNIEVREVTVSAPEGVQEGNAQFNMTSQQFSEQQRAFQNQQQQGNKPYYAAQHNGYNPDEIPQDYAGRIKSAVDGLDTYV